MLTVKAKDLWFALSEDEDADEKLVKKLEKLDILQICVDFSMSEQHIGGDDIVRIVGEALDAVAQGYKIANWCGPEAQVLIIGYHDDDLKIV